MLVLDQVRHVRGAATRIVPFRTEVVLNPGDKVSARLAVLRPADQQNQKGSRAVSHHGRDRHKAEKYAMNVIAEQPHDDGPGDHESPVLQFEAEKFRSNGERACHGFESKRHGSARESAQKL